MDRLHRADAALNRFLDDAGAAIGHALSTVAATIAGLVGVGLVLLVTLAVIIWAWRTVFQS